MDAQLINNCPDCGKKFRDVRDLNRHKTRKTPCIIIGNQKVEDHRCIYCNKIYSNKSNLTKHTKTCARKNGVGGEIPAGVALAEELRIMREENLVEQAKRDEENAKDRAAMQEMLKFMAEEIKKLNEKINNQQPITINNNGVTNNINNGVIYNHYTNPNVEHLFTQPAEVRKLVGQHGCRLPEELITPIYFDKNHPENMTVHCISDKTGEYTVYGTAGWEYADADVVVKNMRLVGYKTAERMIDEHCTSAEHKDYGKTIKQYENIYDKDTDRELVTIRKNVANKQEITKRMVPKK